MAPRDRHGHSSVLSTGEGILLWNHFAVFNMVILELNEVLSVAMIMSSIPRSSLNPRRGTEMG